MKDYGRGETMSATAASIAAVRAARKAAGMCTECDTKHLPGHSVCQRHYDMRAERLRSYNKGRKASGRCYCGAKVKPSRDRCPTCLAIENERVKALGAERKAMGRCVSCGRKSRKGMVHCTLCATRAAGYYEARKRRRIFRAQRKGQLARALGVSFEPRFMQTR